MKTTLNNINGEGDLSGGQSLSPNIFDPKKLIIATWRRRYLVIFICLIGVGGTAYYTFRLPKAYAATATVMLENQLNPMSTQPQSIRAEANKWHIILAMSGPVRQRAEKLSGDKLAPAGKSATAPTFEATFQEQMLYFQVVDGDPERAAKFANAWADAFTEELLQRMQNPRRKTRDALEKKFLEQERECRKRENELDTVSKTVDLKELARQRAHCEELTRKVSATSTEVETLGIERAISAERAAAPLDLTDPRQPYVILINELRLKLDEQKELYIEGSKEITRLQFSIEQAKKLASTWNKSESLKYERSLIEAKNRLSDLTKALDSSSLILEELEKGAQRQKALSESVTDARRDLAELERQRSQLDATEYLFFSSARLWEPAYANTAAIRPDLKKNLLTAGFASIFGVILLVFGLELIDQTVKTPLDLDQKIAGETIGFIPHLKPMKSGSRNGLFPILHSFAGDNLRNLQIKMEMILDMRREGNAAVIVVTSPLPSEGKSFLAMNLAFSFAKSGQTVLLIDGDFRKATLSESQNCKHNTGLGEAMCSGELSRDVLMPTDVAGCSFLPAGKLLDNDLTFIKPGTVEKILTQLKPSYDVIVIDTVPVLALADACVMANFADVALLVARSRQSKFVHVQRAAAILKSARPKALCIVVNAVEAADAKGEDYYCAAKRYGETFEDEKLQTN